MEGEQFVAADRAEGSGEAFIVTLDTGITNTAGNTQNQSLHLDGQTLHVGGQSLHIDGQNLHIDGQNFNIDGQNLHIDGQNVHLEGQTIHIDGQTVPVQFVLHEEQPSDTTTTREHLEDDIIQMQYSNTPGGETGAHSENAMIQVQYTNVPETGEQLESSLIPVQNTTAPEPTGEHLENIKVEHSDTVLDERTQKLLSSVPVPHTSILRAVNEIPVLGLSDAGFHCALCPPDHPAWSSKDEAVQHFTTNHWDLRIQIGHGINAARCACVVDTVLHYHCPYCGATEQDVNDMSDHVSACIQSALSSQMDQTPSESTEPKPDPDQDPEVQPSTKTKQQQQSSKTYHKSIVKALSEVELKACRRCCRGAKVHCPFCPSTVCKPQPLSKMHQHLMTNHWKLHVPYKDMFILKCMSACKSTMNGRPLGAHWHCPLCDRLLASRQVMRSHLESHRRGRVHRHRTNAEWAAMLGPEAARKVFNSLGDPDAVTVDKENKKPEQPVLKQVFQTVAAVLSQDMMMAIPGSITDFFSHLQKTCNLQYSASDQWCLLQADWHTMSSVQRLLNDLLARPLKQQDEDMSEAPGPVEPVREHNPAQIGEDEQIVDQSLVEDDEQAGSQAGDSQQSADKCSVNPDVAGGGDPTDNVVNKKVLDTACSDGISSFAEHPRAHSKTKHQPASTHSETSNQGKPPGASEETQKTSTPLTSATTPVVKRSRGRPRKVPRADPPPINQPEVKDSWNPKEAEDTEETGGSRRRKSRLPKRYQDYDTQIESAQEEKSDSTEGKQTDPPYKAPQPAASMVKQVRGRPRKHPPATITPNPSESTTPVAIKPELNNTVLPVSKKQRTEDTPAITIAIDETTGSVLSVAVDTDTAGLKEEGDEEGDSNTDTTPVDQTDTDLTWAGGGLMLVRPKKVVVCEGCCRTYPDHHRFYQHVLGTTCLQKRQRQDPGFTVSAELEQVIQDVNREVKQAQCPRCGKHFKLLLHAKMHYAERTCMKKSNMGEEEQLERNEETGLYHCHHCDFCSPVMHRVHVHQMRKHWKKTERCPLCQKSYSCQAFLREHIKAVHAKGKERAVCDQCGVSVSARLLKQHIKIKHDPTYVRPKTKPLTRPLKCGECDGFETLSYSRFLRHRASAHRLQDKTCPHCGLKFSMTGDLNRHVRMVHEGQNQVAGQCPVCQKTMSKKNIAAHIKMVHEKRRDHACRECGRTFLTKHTLNMHIRTHRGVEEKDTRFLCAFCGKGFSHRTHYSDHLNTHTGARPYVCNICNKTFRCNPALHKHRELHRPINLQCEICQLHFLTRKALRVHHNQVHHGDVEQHQVGTRGSSSQPRCVCGAEYTNQQTLTQHQLTCTQWAQANPNKLNQMAMVQLDSASAQNTAMQSRTYIVLEGQQGQETVMVLQSVDGGAEVLQTVDGGAEVLQTVDGGAEVLQTMDSGVGVLQTVDDDADAALQTKSEDNGPITTELISDNIKPDNNTVANMTGTEVLADLSHDDVLTMAAAASNEGDMVTMDDPAALLALQQQQQELNNLQPDDEASVDLQATDTNMNRYLCGYCQKLFSTLEDVQTHMVAEHIVAESGEVELALHGTTPNDPDQT